MREGDIAPGFSLRDQHGTTHTLRGSLGKWVVLYFYPKDDTPGCTTEACEFQADLHALTERGVVLLGVSADTEESHRKFAEKYHVEFPLLADPAHETIEAYGAWGEKTMAGKIYMGIFRTTFVIDPEGKVAAVYEKVRPEGHSQEILQRIDSVKNTH